MSSMDIDRYADILQYVLSAGIYFVLTAELNMYVDMSELQAINITMWIHDMFKYVLTAGLLVNIS